MSTEDQNIGSPTESTSPEVAPSTPDSSDVSTQIPHDDTPINPVSDAINAIRGELNGVINPEQQVTPQGVAAGQRPAPQNNNTPRPRDFTGLEPDEIPLFKQMGNAAYAKLYPLYLESKKFREREDEYKRQLQELQGASLYEADGAWKLAPEYDNLTSSKARLSGEAQFWQQQLENIESGNQWTPLMKDPTTGQLYAGEPQDPSPGAKAQILNNLTKANNYLMQLDTEISQYEGGFKSKHQQYVASVSQMRDKVLTKEQQTMLQPHVEKELAKFPSYIRAKPETQLAATLLVVNQGLIKVIQQLRGNSANVAMTNRTQQNAGPAGGNVAAPGSGKGGTVQDIWQEFRKAKAGMV